MRHYMPWLLAVWALVGWLTRLSTITFIILYVLNGSPNPVNSTLSSVKCIVANEHCTQMRLWHAIYVMFTFSFALNFNRLHKFLQLNLIEVHLPICLWWCLNKIDSKDWS